MYKLILVDDEPWALTGLQQILPWEEYGFTVCGCCSSGQQALAEIRKKKPDAVFTDIRMPQLSGIELISQVRSRHGLEVEFVIISAYSDFEVARRAIDYGAVGYVLKPLETGEVLKAVERLKRRLDQKRGKFSVHIELNVPESLSRAVSQLQEEVLPGRSCFVAVTGERCELPGGWSIVPLDIRGERNPACFCFSPARGLPALPCPSGWSMPRQDAGELESMVREAQASFRGQFLYSDHPTVAAIQSYLGQNYGQALSLGHLASQFFLSENYLCELFRKNTGDTILNFLKKIRLENARRLLRESTLSIKEIAAAVGFGDYSYFGRTFRRNTGYTPDQYRSLFSDRTASFSTNERMDG